MFIVCVVLCAVFRLTVVLFSVIYVICVLCLTVVPLPPGEDPFAVKINNILILYSYPPLNKYKNLLSIHHTSFMSST
jgi:hypothetical protein